MVDLHGEVDSSTIMEEKKEEKQKRERSREDESSESSIDAEHGLFFIRFSETAVAFLTPFT